MPYLLLEFLQCRTGRTINMKLLWLLKPSIRLFVCRTVTYRNIKIIPCNLSGTPSVCNSLKNETSTLVLFCTPWNETSALKLQRKSFNLAIVSILYFYTNSWGRSWLEFLHLWLVLFHGVVLKAQFKKTFTLLTLTFAKYQLEEQYKSVFFPVIDWPEELPLWIFKKFKKVIKLAHHISILVYQDRNLLSSYICWALILHLLLGETFRCSRDLFRKKSCSMIISCCGS